MKPQIHAEESVHRRVSAVSLLYSSEWSLRLSLLPNTSSYLRNLVLAKGCALDIPPKSGGIQEARSQEPAPNHPVYGVVGLSRKLDFKTAIPLHPCSADTMSSTTVSAVKAVFSLERFCPRASVAPVLAIGYMVAALS